LAPSADQVERIGTRARAWCRVARRAFPV